MPWRKLCAPSKEPLNKTYRYGDRNTPDYTLLCGMWFGLPNDKYWFPCYSYFAEQPYDKPTLVLPELTHSVIGVSYTIDALDKRWYSWPQGLGLWSGGCYRHSCTARLAAENEWNGYKLINNAQGFAWYAKYIR